MRLHLILPSVKPDEFAEPTQCPEPQCGGQHFRLHQIVTKPLRDTVYQQVEARRYQCLRCRRTFRVYPAGVTHAQVSQRVRGLAVMLYLLGLSYGAVSLALTALGASICKSRVYDAVQEAAERVSGLKRQAVFNAVQTTALGGDVTSVKCQGQWLPLGLTVDAIDGTVLTVDQLSGEDAASLREWISPIAQAVGAELLVSDDADAFKRVARQLGLKQQVCKSHVVRNTEALIASLMAALDQDDGSLAAIGVSVQQAREDLSRLDELIHTRQPDDEAVLEALHQRYVEASGPRKDEQASIAYRLRMLFLDRWNLWRDLTRYRTWRGPGGETIDGTNNASERGIGWWIKERYRSMRGYKRAQSAVNVSRLLAWCGNQLGTGADLSRLVA